MQSIRRCIINGILIVFNCVGDAMGMFISEFIIQFFNQHYD